jgi:pyridoxal phosphate enzyme (YggS family)
MSIVQNVARVRERLEAAARRAGRSPDNVRFMAVTKTVCADRIREAYSAGIRLFGENRVQEFAAKAEALRHLHLAEWHMIGHLQTNKARTAVELFGAIDSLDSARLMQKLNHAARELGKKLPVLIEINIGDEAAKTGVAPDSAELEKMLVSAPQFESLEIHGLMTVPPYDGNPQGSRRYFRKMRELFVQIEAKRLPSVGMQVLSMGMSHDFEVAIEEGATCIRIGTAIFGERPVPRSHP